MLITHARQLCFVVADCFVTTNNGIDSRFAFSLQLRDTRTRVAQLARISFSFQLSVSMLARGAVALAREALGLLR